MIRLLHGDCLAMLKEVEPGSVDLILCDPPYSSGGTHAGDRKASTTAKYTDNDFNGAARLPAFSGDNMDQRSFTAFMRWVCSELRQKTREGGDPGDVRGLEFLSTPSGWRATAKTDKVFVCFCAKGRRICLFKTRKEKNLPVAF